jgi:ATP-dependent HslUV protease subunit HslV
LPAPPPTASRSSRASSEAGRAPRHLERAAVELARDWRTDRALRRLEAMMLVADARHMFLLSGTGDLIEPDDDVMGIRVGRAVRDGGGQGTDQPQHARTRARSSSSAMAIAADICIYTNGRIV